MEKYEMSGKKTSKEYSPNTIGLVPIDFSNMNTLDGNRFSNFRFNRFNERKHTLKSKESTSSIVNLNKSQQNNNINNNNNTININYNKEKNWENRNNLIQLKPEEKDHHDINHDVYNRENSSPDNYNFKRLVFNRSRIQTSTSPQNQRNSPQSNTNVFVGGRSSHWKLKKSFPPQIHKRVFGLMERFTSRSHLLRISEPLSLPAHNPYSHLSHCMWLLFCEKAQKEETYLHKLELWKAIHLNIRRVLSRYGLFMVGSTMSGLGMETSDIDMCLLVKQCLNDPRSDALSYLQNIQAVLYNSDYVISPEIILAKVPILKFKDAQYGFEVDLNCNNAVGIRNTHLLHCYAYMDWRVRPLVIVIKHWAQANDINDAKRMTISSYSLALMVIHFLQHGVSPPVLPCLHSLYPEKFLPNSSINAIDIQEELPPYSSENKQTLGELLMGFLHYYTYFDYNKFAISVRERGVLLKEECRQVRAAKNDASQWKLLCIEEPFELTNTARSVYDVETFEHIKFVFQRSYKFLQETKMLNSIFLKRRGSYRR